MAKYVKKKTLHHICNQILDTIQFVRNAQTTPKLSRNIVKWSLNNFTIGSANPNWFGVVIIWMVLQVHNIFSSGSFQIRMSNINTLFSLDFEQQK